MMRNLGTVIEQIAPHNNVYRDRTASIRDKLAAMWQIGDILMKTAVTKPHSLGWAIQRETGGLIKRPTVFRSYKFRVLWPNKLEFLERFGDIRGLSSLVEMLPLLDPGQRVKHRVPANIVDDLRSKMRVLPPARFKAELDAVKKRYSDGTLGKTYDRNRGLATIRSVAESFQRVYARLQRSVARNDGALLGTLRTQIPENELRDFSTMCLALTTRENQNLCPNPPRNGSLATFTAFRRAYDGAAALLRDSPDARRAKFRRLFGPEALADLADLCNSAATDQGVKAYKQRARASIPL